MYLQFLFYSHTLYSVHTMHVFIPNIVLLLVLLTHTLTKIIVFQNIVFLKEPFYFKIEILTEDPYDTVKNYEL